MTGPFDDNSPRRWCPNCRKRQPAYCVVFLELCRDATCPLPGRHAHGRPAHTDVACCICGLPLEMGHTTRPARYCDNPEETQ